MKLTTDVTRSSALAAVLDQAIYAATNLLLQVGIARFAPPEEFGAFAVTSTFFLAAAVIHQTCIVEPMFVFSAQRFRAQIASYHRRLVYTWSLAFGAGVAATGLSLALIAIILQSPPPLTKSLIAFSLTSPALLYFWLLRRIAFVLGRLDLAVLGGTVYGIALILGLGLAWKLAVLSSSVGIALSGIAAVLAACTIATLLKRPMSAECSPPDMLYQHLRYGRWAFGSEVVNWLISNGPLLILPLWFGLTASATFRVLILLFMPLQQITAALNTLYLRKIASDKSTRTVRHFWLQASLLFLAACIYTIAASLAGPHLLLLIFGNEYSLDSGSIWLAGAGVTFFVTTQNLLVALRANERSSLVLAVHLIAISAMLLLTPLVATYGIVGALSIQTIGWACAMVATIYLVLKTTLYG
ncbi:hypothetical protein JQ599_27635 [Bradyrhizobium diazoefficiens]|nr:hypothetical protein [Bradyrhizobium diazoefficiens]MBR0703706.1 hypothetical protein [Bradyrhizobium diazoefficiens]MBR0772462.1 hypothetical protein [Bradyrhizobium diazoefficiens]